MKKITLCLLSLLTSLVGNSQHDYAKAQYLSTYFLGAQRCGDNNSWIHGACHTTDGQSVGKDLTGGWHDCGDYIKFHHTGPFTALMFLMGYDNFTVAYADEYSQANSAPPSNGIPDILDEVKIETDYLIRCVETNKVYWQVSDGKDHNSFSEPVTQSNESVANGGGIRTVYSATEGHSNALGNSAAALALMSISYQTFDPTYATECLDAAKKYYALATQKLEATDDPDDYYGGTYGLANKDYSDELGMAAVLLYRATNQNSYLASAETYAGNFSNTWDDFYYGNVSPLLNLELYKVTNNSSYLNTVASKVNGYSLSSCGYYHSTNWGSLPFAANAAFLSALYAEISGTTTGYSFAKSNIDFILGSHGNISADAPANFSFLIGYNELNGGYPQHPHHAAAFGQTSNVWSKYTTESNSPGSIAFAHELKGGLAGGPESECSNFTDNISNYVSSEYCSYYGAGFTGAVAAINKKENNLITASSENRMQPSSLSTSYLSNERILLKNAAFSEYNIRTIEGKLIEKIQFKGAYTLDVSSFKKGIYILENPYSQNSTKLIVH